MLSYCAIGKQLADLRVFRAYQVTANYGLCGALAFCYGRIIAQ